MDSVSVSHGASARQAQLAKTVHALHLHVFGMAYRLVKYFCRRPEGAHAGRSQCSYPVSVIDMHVNVLPKQEVWA